MAKKKQKHDKISNTEPELSAQNDSLQPLRKPFKIACLVIVIILLHLHVFSNFDFFLSIKDDQVFLYFLTIRNLKLACLIILTFALLVISIRYFSNRFLSNIFSIFAWLLLFLYGIELYLCIYPPSQGNGEAIVSKIWFRKYWKTNQYGFRDKEYIADELQFKKNILLYLGDSFVAGHGIKNPEDRTFNLLEQSLNSSYTFINLGKNGLGSVEEYNILKSFPAQPKVVILAHVPNDIEEILPSENTSYNQIYINSSSPFIDFLFEHSRNSVFLDLSYHFIKMVGLNSLTVKNNKSKITRVYEWYKTDSLFSKHLSTLQNIVDYTCDTLDAKLIFISYPENDDIDSCDIYINKKIITNLKQHKNMYYLNLSPTFKKVKSYNRAVNLFDGHPSKKINSIVADSLLQLIKSERFKYTN